MSPAGPSGAGSLVPASAWRRLMCIAYEGVPVGTIKRHVTGKGNASKAQVIEAVNTFRG